MTRVDLHYVIDGPDDAPPLVLGPSLGTSTEMWRDNVAELAKHHRVIRYDHLGQGQSRVPPGQYDMHRLGAEVIELLRHLGIERAAVGGVSLGGMVAMWLGSNAPEYVDRVIAACTSAYIPGPLWAERAAAVREAGSTEPIADAVVNKWLTPRFAAEHPEQREHLRALLVASPADGYVACCDAIEHMDLRNDLGRIAAPTLVISGSDDPSTPREHQELIAELIPDARHETIGPGAHLSNVEQPDAFNALVLEHLR